MRLHTITEENWVTHSPFVDTLLLPITPILLREKQLSIGNYRIVTEVAKRVEEKLTGRVLLLPAIYYDDAHVDQQVAHLVSSSGFQYVTLLMHHKDEERGTALSETGGHICFVENILFDTVEDICNRIQSTWENGS